MWNYCKRLQYPVKIARPNAAAAKIILEQFGGPDGELGAANRYLAQRYSAPYDETKAVLTDIGTEELSHVEMICTIVYQLTRNLTIEQIKEQGFSDYFVEHTTGLYPCSASGGPFNALAFASKGDIITDLSEDMAADGAIKQKQQSYCKIKKIIKYA
ncbi:MAG: manganese catalase family protein [Oscillospiraceae bacterium]